MPPTPPDSADSPTSLTAAEGVSALTVPPNLVAAGVPTVLDPLQQVEEKHQEVSIANQTTRAEGEEGYVETDNGRTDYDDQHWKIEVSQSRSRLPSIRKSIIPNAIVPPPPLGSTTHGNSTTLHPTVGSGNLSGKRPELPCPQEKASWFSLLFISWMSPLLALGAKRPLELPDLYNTYERDRTERCYAEFEEMWEKEVQKAADQGRRPKLLGVFIRLIGWELLGSMFLFSLSAADSLMGPYYLNHLVAFVALRAYDPSLVSDWDGYQWCLWLFISAFVASFGRNHGMHHVFRLFLRVRNVAIHHLFRKSLRISSKNRGDGAIQNLMSVDTQRLADFAQQFHNTWSALPLIVLGLWQLSNQVQVAATMSAFGVMIAFIPVAGVLTGKQVVSQKKASAGTDQRVNLINETLQAIRVVKFYAWETPMLNVIHDARDNELTHLKTYAFQRSLTFSTLIIVPFMVSIVTFTVYVATGGIMNPATVFTAIALINVIRMPLMFLPMGISGLSQVLVALSRMEAFLRKPEVKNDRRVIVTDDKFGVEIKNATFDWRAGHEEEEKEREEEERKEKEKKEKQAARAQKKKGITKVEDKKDGATVEETTKIELQTSGTTTGSTTNDEHKETNEEQKESDELLKDRKEKDEKEKNNKDKNKPKHPILTNINLRVRNGELLTILGPVGSGKSSLVQALLGEIGQTTGELLIGGKISYVPQTAFITNDTVRANILFGLPYDAERYDAVVKACALEHDFEHLPSGDMTEIGERGINISGGQKQRISCARAAYNPYSDIIILDDCLSAVDRFVAHTIFHECINGIMRKKTRIFVTHSLQFIQQSDRICMLEATAECPDMYSIGAYGTYSELEGTNKEFMSLMATYNKGKDELKGTEEQTEGDGEEVGKTTEKAADEDKTTAAEKKKKGALMTAEERDTGVIGWKVYKSYFEAGAKLPFFLFLSVAYVGTQACQTGSDFWLSYYSGQIGTPYEQSQGYYLGIYAGFGATLMCALFTRSLLTAWTGVSASRTLHRALIQNVLGKKMSVFDTVPLGRFMNRFSKDFYQVDFLLPQMFEFAVNSVVNVVGVFIVIAITVPIALAVFAILFLVFIHVGNHYRYSNREVQRIESISRTPIFSHFGETLNGLVSIRALKVQNIYIQSNLERIEDNSRAFYLTKGISFWLRLRMDLIGSGILVSGALLGLASNNAGPAISAGQYGVLLTYSLGITQLLNWTILLATFVEAMMNSVERILFYMQPTELEQWEVKKEGVSEVEYPKKKKVDDDIKSGARKWPDRGGITISNLTLRYRPGLDLVLKGISVNIPAGARVGICGRTGSGKSTTLLALFRVVEPAGGQILIDGVDIQDLSLEALRRNLSIIPQDPVIFSGTVRYNLDPFGQCDDASIWEALDYVQLKGLVQRKPKKLEEKISEESLSLGQRQLLCLARAMLRKPKVLCLDECTANVDIETDVLIQKAVREKFSESTVLTIAHRLNTIMDYDHVLVLDQGLVAEFDSPDNLRNKPDGIFANMLRSKENKKK